MAERIVRCATVMTGIGGGHAGQQQQIAGVRLMDLRVRSIVQRVHAMPGGRRRRTSGEQAGEQQGVAGPNEESGFRLHQGRVGHVVDGQTRFVVTHWREEAIVLVFCLKKIKKLQKILNGFSSMPLEHCCELEVLAFLRGDCVWDPHSTGSRLSSACLTL